MKDLYSSASSRVLSMALAAAGIAAGAVAFGLPSSAFAGQTIQGPNGTSITVGGEMRATFRSTDGPESTNDFAVESARLLTSGQITSIIGVTINTEIDRGDNSDIRLMDAIARFEFNDYFNVWAGLLLPPSDRANLDGPYYLGTWDYPGVVSGYPQIFQGRDLGVSVFGQTGGGKFKYAAGAFEGCSNNGDNACSGTSNEDDNLIYSGKLTYNFWDPEPGYYTSSDYYGSKDILAVSITGMFQKDATGVLGAAGDYEAWNIDVLMQKKLADGGVISLEGAYYDYSTGGVGFHAGLLNGQAYLAQASYLIPIQIGIGKLQPVIRYQEFEADLGYADTTRLDGGVNYIINEHKARLSAQYSTTEVDGADDVDQFTLGVQLQY